MKKNISRRKALKTLTGASSFLFDPSIFKAVVMALVGNAVRAKADLGGPVKNLVSILNYGAPTPWQLHGFLNPTNESSKFMANASVQNFLGTNVNQPLVNYSGDSSLTSYQQTGAITYNKNGAQKTIYLPKIWDYKIPILKDNGTFSVTEGPLMREMLPNICLIRGVDMGADLGHDNGPSLFLLPSSNRPSLSGLVADLSATKLPAIGVSNNISTNIGFKATRATISRTTTNNSNPIQDIVSPFLQDTDPEILSHSTNFNIRLKSLFDSAIAAMGQAAAAKQPGSEKLYLSFQNSKDLFDQAQTTFANLNQEFESRKAKYEGLSSLSRDQATAPGCIPLADISSNCVHNFARGLAVAEYFITKGLSASITIDAGHLTHMGNVIVNGGSQSISNGYFFDEHAGSFAYPGNRQAPMCHLNFLYRALMASLFEFKKALGAHFADTVITYSAEYGRFPQTNGSGSEHAVDASSVLIYSGAIENFIPIGNILRDHPSQPDARGTYGKGALVQIEGQASPKIITNNDLAATVSGLLGVQSPVSGTNLITTTTAPGSDLGKLRSKAEDPKNV